ncbi:tyrosine-type recombinase/integrase [Kordiimonas sp.]|uniref:tyrosine-type recombinase/integrase n=1 Tax=Kordiimonas sp. TaxID=1970157 RepID=UPI003A9018BD
MIELTDKFIRAIKPPSSGRDEYSDRKRAGLRLRVSATGRFTWMYERRIKGGRKMKATLGQWPAIGLSEARRLALAIEAEAAQGIDRVSEHRAERENAERMKRETMTTAVVIELYGTLHLANLKNKIERKERCRNLERAFKAKLDSPVSSLTTADCQRAIDEKTAAGKKTMANRLRSHLRHFTGWAARREYLPDDICLAIDRPAREMPRELILSISQVRTIYESADMLGPVWGNILKLLILTGQRNAEIRELRWDEVNLSARRITKAGSVTKNNKAHITHLSGPANSIIEEMRGLSISEWYVFSFDGANPPAGMGKAKTRLDNTLGDDFPPWRVHDLRTAMATALAEAGFSEGVVDRILNHSASGSAPSAVARVYMQGDLLAERARAVDAWAQMITGTPAEATKNAVDLGSKHR